MPSSGNSMILTTRQTTSKPPNGSPIYWKPTVCWCASIRIVPHDDVMQDHATTSAGTRCTPGCSLFSRSQKTSRTGNLLPRSTQPWRVTKMTEKDPRYSRELQMVKQSSSEVVEEEGVVENCPHFKSHCITVSYSNH